jgi:PAS domain S-box-containing protein
VVSDITERKRAEEVLAASEKRFRVAAESLVDVIYEWDLKQKIDWYGDIDRLMGNPTGGFPKTLDGWAATLHPEDKERVLAAVDAQLKGTAPYDVEYRVRKGDGEWRWWSARGTALRDERDEPYRFIGSITDTTERKRAEEEIRGLNESLERKVQERTSQLEAANKELEAFSYSVSHDLRAPLRAIDGFSRIVLDEHTPALPPEAQRYLRLVQDNTHQMERLVDDLLAFSRLSRQPMAKQLVDPAGLVRAALQDLHAEQAGRQIHLVIRDLPACQADPGLLKQVWVNLLSNALKFTRRRERAVIEVGAYEEDHHPVYYVKDNGVGFDMRYVGKLFGVFQRLHKAEEYEGTGVGLAIVQRIVHRHGGRVWAEAKVDQGATFWFTLEGGTGNDEGHGGDPAGRGQSE